MELSIPEIGRAREILAKIGYKLFASSKIELAAHVLAHTNR
jgi:hypothetical protein